MTLQFDMTSQAGSPESSARAKQRTDSQQLSQSLPETPLLLRSHLSPKHDQNGSEGMPPVSLNLQALEIHVESTEGLTTTPRRDSLSEKIDSVVRLMMGFGLYVGGLVLDIYQKLPSSIDDDENGPSDFPDHDSSRHVFGLIVLLEDQAIDEGMEPEEVMQLWTILLTKEQRQDFMKKIKDVNVNSEIEDISKALEHTELSRMIQAWARFKKAARRAALDATWSIASGRGIAWSLWKTLRVFMVLETKVHEGLPAALSSGRRIPNLITRPAMGSDFTADTPFAQLFAAFAERARCRNTSKTANRVLTNADVLSEMLLYVLDLKMLVEAVSRKKKEDLSRKRSASEACGSGSEEQAPEHSIWSDDTEGGFEDEFEYDRSGNDHFTYHGFHLINKTTGRIAQDTEGYGFLKRVRADRDLFLAQV